MPVQGRSQGSEVDAAVSVVLEYTSNPRPLDLTLPSSTPALADDLEQAPQQELLGRSLQLQANVQLLPSVQVGSQVEASGELLYLLQWRRHSSITSRCTARLRLLSNLQVSSA